MWSDISIGTLFGVLVALIVSSAFFSGSETSIFSINRYRLKHQINKGRKGAIRVGRLLDRPDRLLGVILLGNNFVNILASAIATVIAIRLMGESGIAIATGLLTLVILLFAEVAPKTVAALHPERFAYPASFILSPMLRILYPLVWVINLIANNLLRLFGIKMHKTQNHALSRDELRTVVHEAKTTISRSHQKMMLNLFDLETVSVKDIMVPRNEIVGIDLDQNIDEIQQQLLNCQHTRILLYEGDIDNTIGIIHLRNYLALNKQGSADKEDLRRIAHEAYYIPETTPLNSQLLNFQKAKRRIALIVDEFGDIQGLATLDDILEEIVGRYTTDPSDNQREVHLQEDGTYLIDGTISIRELNRLLDWKLSTDGPKTLNGMVLDYLETIPESSTSLLLEGHPIDVIQTASNTIKTVRIDPGFQIIGKRAE